MALSASTQAMKKKAVSKIAKGKRAAEQYEEAINLKIATNGKPQVAPNKCNSSKTTLQNESERSKRKPSIRP